MIHFDPQSYGPVIAPLLEFDSRRPLEVGRPNAEARARLKKFSTDTAFAHARPVDTDMAACCIAGIWLLHDCLDESHTISQGIDTPSGSFWHAIMHRRESDFSNAKYWFRNVGQHPVFAALGEQAQRSTDFSPSEHPVTGVSPSEKLDDGLKSVLRDGEWDPFAFVDLCQAVARGQTAARELCRDIQQAEWELLFDYCYRQAIGK